MVEIMVKLSEVVAGRFGETPELAVCKLLEAAAVEGYRTSRLSRGQVREMLGLDWHETEEFLAEHGCFRHYTADDLAEDRQTLADLPSR
jgi:predicted HTH domain antitoxin